MTTRLTATERKDDLLDAAMIEFAEHGYEGTSTEDIARRAGISQPYLFRLFGTKKELFKASVARCFRETLEMFQRAAEGQRGEEALQAMGQAYMNVLENRVWLRAQMQAYAACEDPEICAGRAQRPGRPRGLRGARLRPAARADRHVLLERACS